MQEAIRCMIRDGVEGASSLWGAIRTVVIADAYHDKDFDFSGTKKFDQGTGYRSKSFLCIPLKNYSDEEHVNVGYGSDVTIGEVAKIVADTVGFQGTLAA